jgi:hypothetical protein
MRMPGRWRLWLLRHARQFPWIFVLAWLAAIVLLLATGTRPRGWWFGALLVLIVLSSTLAIWARWQREVAIRESPLPQFLKRKLREAYPHLEGRDCELVERGFRQFFMACLRSEKRFVAMPSKAVDAYWHAFILHTRAYAQWCELAVGRFVHHTPAEALGGNAGENDGLRRAWYWSCREESIAPRRPSRLPLLFALDAKLGIEGGFRYVTDCGGLRRRGETALAGAGAVHCGGDFADGGFAGDAASFGGVESSDGDGGPGSDSSGSSCGGDGGGGCGSE